jgi:hypothetical protein
VDWLSLLPENRFDPRETPQVFWFKNAVQRQLDEQLILFCFSLDIDITRLAILPHFNVKSSHDTPYAAHRESLVSTICACANSERADLS